MTLRHRFKTALGGLRTNKTRSALTILGIVIGIAAIILVMSIGTGAQELILSQVRGLGSQTIIVEPGREPTGPSDFAEVFTDSLKARDLEVLKRKENVPNLKDVTPNVILSATASFENETYRNQIIGSTEVLARILDIYPNRGSFFTDQDVREKAAVAVIGVTVEDELFGERDALGEKIRIKGRLFRIVGVIPKKGQVGIFNADEMIIVPYTTAQQYLLGINHFHSMMLRADSENNVDLVVRDVTRTLRDLHRIDDPEKDDFHVTSQQDAMDRVKLITDILTILLVSVAAISLVVGGVGIMNIMLVSVTERTREIGLRKAIGATDRDVLVQFLLEAVILTILGGCIGIAIGTGISLFVALIMQNFVSAAWTFTFPFFGAFIGVSVSAVIGLVFGIYPAREAAKKSPIEALRYE